MLYLFHRTCDLTVTNALANAHYQCEYDPSHVTFIGKSTGLPFVEAHHLIPMKNQPEYEYSLDIEANIVALCPNCHRKIHLGKESDMEEMKQKLLKWRNNRLKRSGILDKDI